MLRIFVGILGGFACALNSGLGSGLSVAIVSMVKYNQTVSQDEGSGTCISANSTQSENVVKRGEFEWSESFQVSIDQNNTIKMYNKAVDQKNKKS